MSPFLRAYALYYIKMHGGNKVTARQALIFLEEMDPDGLYENALDGLAPLDVNPEEIYKAVKQEIEKIIDRTFPPGENIVIFRGSKNE